MVVQRNNRPTWKARTDLDFWTDLKRSISYLVRDILIGRDVAKVAGKLRAEGVNCSDSLLYKWANPNDVQIPNMEQFFLLIKHTENCEPLKEIGQACGFWPVPQELGDLGAVEYVVQLLRERE